MALAESTLCSTSSPDLFLSCCTKPSAAAILSCHQQVIANVGKENRMKTQEFVRWPKSNTFSKDKLRREIVGDDHKNRLTGGSGSVRSAMTEAR